MQPEGAEDRLTVPRSPEHGSAGRSGDDRGAYGAGHDLAGPVDEEVTPAPTRRCPNTSERYVDATSVAQHLSMKRRQVLALTRRKKLPGHPADPAARRKTWRYKLSEIDRTLTRNAQQPRNNRLGVARNSGDNHHGSPRSRKEQSDG